jgi:outer membrane protein OmpA-like peptidoglycan-associated protein
VIVFALVAGLAPCVWAGDDSITLTLDRKTMPQSLLHPGRFFTKQEIVTVYDYVIRNYLGQPIEGFTIQTASGLTKVPIDTVEEIRFKNWVKRRTDDIYLIERVVEADMFFTDGSQMRVLTNADFGTIEGRTELGHFFLGDPLAVRQLVFNRVPVEEVVVAKVVEEPPAPVVVKPPEPVKVEKPVPPPDSDGDGVPDYQDKCPNTPKGAPVNETGCWTIKGIKFDYNKWDIKPQYRKALDESIGVLKLNPAMTIDIQGHTDSIASEQYNQILSEKRAKATRDYFVANGVAPDRMSVRGLGETMPIASNDTPEGRAGNRRIEIKILTR